MKYYYKVYTKLYDNLENKLYVWLYSVKFKKLTCLKIVSWQQMKETSCEVWTF